MDVLLFDVLLFDVLLFGTLFSCFCIPVIFIVLDTSLALSSEKSVISPLNLTTYSLASVTLNVILALADEFSAVFVWPTIPLLCPPPSRTKFQAPAVILAVTVTSSPTLTSSALAESSELAAFTPIGNTAKNPIKNITIKKS